MWTRRLLSQINLQRRISTSVTGRQFRLCIVGSGPAGFYTAQHILKGNENVCIDIVDRLPVPFGLVRFGVAPDHPEVKNVINTFSQCMEKFSDRCNFIGNIEVGKQISCEELRSLYDAVILCYGAEDDKKLNIPGEKLTGVYSAREFVGWYNGLPEFSDVKPNLDAKSAVILGQGNVALDISRLLLMPIDDLAKTDICEHAMKSIAASKLEQIFIVGRRGPLQTSFTIKELREQTKLPNVRADVRLEDFAGISLDDLQRPRKRLTELLLMTAENSKYTTSSRSWCLRFLLSPNEIICDDTGQVAGVKFTKNTLQGEGDPSSHRAIPTLEEETIQCDVVIKSVGYKSVPIDNHTSIPFNNQTNTIPNVRGRVVGCPGVYCSGWVKRGPVGVIASTLTDAFETADCVLEDIKNGVIEQKQNETCKPSAKFYEKISGSPTVNFQEWGKIDLEEIARGKPKGKPREKILTIQEMLAVAKS